MIIKETQYLPYGRVIVLNGPSSSGKTTLARGLMASLSDHHYVMAVNSLITSLISYMVNRQIQISCQGQRAISWINCE
jgi:uridine kinase